MATQLTREDFNRVQAFAAHRMWMYNHEHPNMASDGIIPEQQLAMAA